MRVGVVSDVHSNLTALQAVLKDMGKVDAVWCLGDFVGYGPWPNECIELLRERGLTAIAGNHDLAAIGAISTQDFNYEAGVAADWTAEQLTAESRDFLTSLEPVLELDEVVTLAHGSPRDPIWEYVIDARIAIASFGFMATDLCFVGHSHIPSVFAVEGDKLALGHMEDKARRELTGRTIANPGSVGQPRDRDPRASYLIYDTSTPALEWHRVSYNIKATQKKMRQEALPTHFIERLDFGI
jgi:diadenosine tetraphosphatase ApaH/serine/threonine PP2A family protein phosphatase